MENDASYALPLAHHYASTREDRGELRRGDLWRNFYLFDIDDIPLSTRAQPASGRPLFADVETANAMHLPMGAWLGGQFPAAISAFYTTDRTDCMLVVAYQPSVGGRPRRFFFAHLNGGTLPQTAKDSFAAAVEDPRNTFLAVVGDGLLSTDAIVEQLVAVKHIDPRNILCYRTAGTTIGLGAQGQFGEVVLHTASPHIAARSVAPA
jgi:hypothetical protein